MRLAFVAAFVMLWPVWAQGAAPLNEPVTMSAADQAKTGVSTETLAAREESEGVAAIVRAIDPAPLAGLDTDLAAASAAVEASRAELVRVKRLAAQDQSASQQAVESAQAKAAADASALTLLRRRLVLDWGKAFADMPARERADLIAAVASGDAALLRADAPDRPVGVVGDLAISGRDGAAPIMADPLGLSGSVDPRMQTIGLFCTVHGAAAAPLRPGRIFDGEIRTEKKISGVVIPRSAIVRLDAADWAYVRTGEEQFERREIVNPRFIKDGWFVAEGFRPGEAVVDKGAGSLVAVERADEATESD